MTDRLRQDARYAIRSFRRNPGYFTIAVLSLALGIGANTAVFSFFESVFLDPLPYEEADELVMIWEAPPDDREIMTVSPGNYAVWRERSTVFEDMAAFNIHYPVLRGVGEADRLLGSLVAPNFLELIGIRPVLGTGFMPEHAEWGNHQVALISHALWSTRFGSDPAAVGRTIRLDDEAYTVIGIMPAEYRHPEREYANTQIWLPLALGDDEGSFEFRYLRVLARLKDGATLDQAGAEMEAIAAGLVGEVPEYNEGYGVRLVRLDQQMYGAARPGLLLLLGAAGFVLLIVCVNVANLMLARSQQRGREFAVRAAVGAGRGRLASQVLLEAGLIAVAGGAIGIVLVLYSVDVLRSLQSQYVSWFAELRIDARLIGTMLGVTLLTAVAFGLLPAFRASRTDLRDVLTTGPAGMHARGRRSREHLIVAELALTVVLLVSVVLLGRSFLRLTGVGIGFTTSDVLTLELELPVEGYPRERVTQAQDEVLERIRAVAGVRDAALVSDLPFTPWNMYTGVSPDTPPEPGASTPSVEWKTVTPGYFEVMGMRWIAGDPPLAAQRRGGSEAVVVNETLARRLFGDANPIGRQLFLGTGENPTPVVVNGVVGDIRDDSFDGLVEPRLYRSYEAVPRRWAFAAVSTEVAPLMVAPAVRDAITAQDPDIAVAEVVALSALVDASVSGRRLVLGVIAAFGCLALLLAAVGIYGVVSWSVTERTAEMAIRSALGATRPNVLGLVLRQSLGMAALGLVIGGVLALGSVRLIRGLLFGVAPADPISYGIVAAVLAATALVAAWVPGRRASRIQPMEVLRSGH